MKMNLLRCLVISLLFCNSCCIRESNPKVQNISVYDHKKITYTENICTLSEKDNLSRFTNSSNLKILVLINIECSKCVFELKEWEKLVQNQVFSKVDFIFITFGRIDEELAKFYAFDAAKFKYPIFYDKECVFMKKNNLYEESYSLLLNEKNEILIDNGNPIHSNVVKKEYIELINRQMND